MKTPNFSAERVQAYPWAALPRLSHAEATAESALARWFACASSASGTSDVSPAAPASRGAWSRMRRLLRLEPTATITVRSLGARDMASTFQSHTVDDSHAATKIAASAYTPTAAAIDPHAAICFVQHAGLAIEVSGSSAGVRAIVQRLMGGPDELAAPRPLGVAEQSLWSLVVATALEDLGVAGQVVPHLGPAASMIPPRAGPAAKRNASSNPSSNPVSGGAPLRLFFEAQLGDLQLAIAVRAPHELLVRAPGAKPTWVVRSSSSSGMTAAWVDQVRFDLPLVVGRCALHSDSLARLAIRTLITLERPASVGSATSAGSAGLGGSGAARQAPDQIGRAAPLAELDIFGGVIGLRLRPGGLVAEVATGYVRRDMALPDEAHLELTVGLGTTQLSLRQITELAVGQIVQLGRPLGGPFELRAAGQIIGRGELVDVDGELAVRIVSLGN